jgi:hypothetical protein
MKGWITANRVKLNDSKTDALLVHGKNRPHEFLIIAGDVQIVPSECVRNLGVILDSQLTMNDQIRSICKKSYFHLHRIPGLRSLSLSLP